MKKNRLILLAAILSLCSCANKNNTSATSTSNSPSIPSSESISEDDSSSHFYPSESISDSENDSPSEDDSSSHFYPSESTSDSETDSTSEDDSSNVSPSESTSVDPVYTAEITSNPTSFETGELKVYVDGTLTYTITLPSFDSAYGKTFGTGFYSFKALTLDDVYGKSSAYIVTVGTSGVQFAKYINDTYKMGLAKAAKIRDAYFALDFTYFYTSYDSNVFIAEITASNKITGRGTALSLNVMSGSLTMSDTAVTTRILGRSNSIAYVTGLSSGSTIVSSIDASTANPSALIKGFDYSCNSFDYLIAVDNNNEALELKLRTGFTVEYLPVNGEDGQLEHDDSIKLNFSKGNTYEFVVDVSSLLDDDGVAIASIYGLAMYLPVGYEFFYYQSEGGKDVYKGRLVVLGNPNGTNIHATSYNVDLDLICEEYGSFVTIDKYADVLEIFAINEDSTCCVASYVFNEVINKSTEDVEVAIFTTIDDVTYRLFEYSNYNDIGCVDKYNGSIYMQLIPVVDSATEDLFFDSDGQLIYEGTSIDVRVTVDIGSNLM